MKKYALGLSIDGTVLKAALASKDGNVPQIELLDTFDLLEPLDPQYKVEPQQKEGGEVAKPSNRGNPFDLALQQLNKAERSTFSETKSNIDVFMHMLNLVYRKGALLSFTLSDIFVSYKHITRIDKKTDQKIKKAIWSDYYDNANTEPKYENIAYYELPDGSYMSMIHDDPLALCTVLTECLDLMRKQSPRFKLVDSIEFVLAHECARTFELKNDEESCVIFFGHAFTKVFYMQGHCIHAVLPTIHEGAETDTVCETASAKLLFEQDSGRIGSLNRIILAGEVERVQAEDFFHDHWPSVEVNRFEITRAPLHPQLENLLGRTVLFSVPIALALKSLEDHPRPPHVQNFLPRRIRDKQSVFRVDWHGILMLVLLFVGVIALSYQLLTVNKDIRHFKVQSGFLDQRLYRLTDVANQVDSLRAEIFNVKKGTNIIDTLTQKTTRWAPFLEAFSKAYELVGPFSIIRAESVEKGRMSIEAEVQEEKHVAELERQVQEASVVTIVRAEEENGSYLNVKFDCRTKTD